MTRPPPGEGPIVLIVDDDRDMQRWAAALLEPSGYRVAFAPDAMLGMVKMRDLQPRVIVLDLAMPAGGGKIFLERVRELPAYRHIPIIVLSGRVTPEARAELSELGITTVLEKPANPAVFVRAVHAAASATSSPPPPPDTPASA